MKNQQITAWLTAISVATIASFPLTTAAEPTLQVFIEGATYDTEGESWVADVADEPLRLWVIGNTTTNKGAIYDAKLSISYDNIDADVNFTLTSSTTGGLHNFTDPSTPIAAIFNQLNDTGGMPKLGDGTELADHGQYGVGKEWQEWLLGDFTLADSPIADFIMNIPDGNDSTKMGQINVYEIDIDTTAESLLLHFDVYNHFEGTNHGSYKFAPFSHDGETGPGPSLNQATPGPELGISAAAALLLMLLGRRQYKS